MFRATASTVDSCVCSIGRVSSLPTAIVGRSIASRLGISVLSLNTVVGRGTGHNYYFGEVASRLKTPSVPI